jgi:hypothetical protein
MSKKHLEEQKLLIENFNKWINEEKCGEEEIDETAGHYMEAEPIEEDEEQIDEAVGLATTAFMVSKFVTALHKVLSAYNDMSKITDDLLQDPNAPESIKKAATGAKQAGADIKSGAGSIADDIPIGQQLGQKAIEILIKKHTGLDVNLGDLGISIPGLGNKPAPEPTEPESKPEQPEIEPEPEDDESRAAQGLLPKDKADRLAQLKAKYRKKK